MKSFYSSSGVSATEFVIAMGHVYLMCMESIKNTQKYFKTIYCIIAPFKKTTSNYNWGGGKSPPPPKNAKQIEKNNLNYCTGVLSIII